MKNKSIFLPGLNGIRAIASLAVMISHIALSIDGFNVKFHLFGSTDLGKPEAWHLGVSGVTIFFVLSGFLITYLLLLEDEVSPINISKFYTRRILRIWPLYYFYFFACIAVMLILGMKINLNSSLYYVLFAANIPFIFKFVLPFLDHYWSIGVEEQFYLFWPWVFKKFKQKLFLITIIAVVVINVIRYILWGLIPYSNAAIFSIVNRLDCMMIGGLGAMLFHTKNEFFLKFVNNKFSQLFAWLCLIIIACNIKFFNSVIDTTIITVASLVIIVGQINVKNRLINLDIPILNFLGKISYGIYVYHILIIFLFSLILSNLKLDEPYKVFLIYSSIMLTTILVAYLSYEYLEKYFIKLKMKYAIIKSSSSRFN